MLRIQNYFEWRIKRIEFNFRMISNYADLGDRFNTPVELHYSSYHTSNQLQSTIVKYSPAVYKLTYIKYTCICIARDYFSLSTFIESKQISNCCQKTKQISLTQNLKQWQDFIFQYIAAAGFFRYLFLHNFLLSLPFIISKGNKRLFISLVISRLE